MVVDPPLFANTTYHDPRAVARDAGGGNVVPSASSEEDGMEILPGIHRIESDLGERFMCQYLLVGEERTVLVDTGLAETPEEVIVPYLGEIGLGVEDVDEVIISHADVDHCGGNRALKEMNPELRFSGGEALRLGPDWRVEFLHLPGHTPGHLGIWDAKNDAVIIIDAALETGIYDREGNLLQPPRYFDATAYQNTIRMLHSMRPAHLLTAHYQLMRGKEVLDFLDRSLDFTMQVHRVVGEGLENGTTDLWELTKHADAELGPYPASMVELGAGVRTHLGLLGPHG